MNNLWFNISKTKGIWVTTSACEECVSNNDGMTILADNELTKKYERGIYSLKDIENIMTRKYDNVIRLLCLEIEAAKSDKVVTIELNVKIT